MFRTTHHTVVVHRDGKNVRLHPGTPYEFTDEEIRELAVSAPNALRRAATERRALVAPEVTSQFDESPVEDLPSDPPARSSGTRPPANGRNTGTRPARNAAPVAAADDDEL